MMKNLEKRLMKTVVEKTDKEVLTTSQRWMELLIVAGMLLLFGFFAYHQLTNTGFFTAKFGPLEMFCLYGPIFVSLAAPVVRALSSRRNQARPFEAATNLSLALGSSWLWIVFPLNFAHLGDVLPGALRFIISWITDDIGKVLLVLQVIIGPLSAFLVTWKYIAVRRHEPANPYYQQASQPRN
jgi:hypothetical protein